MVASEKVGGGPVGWGYSVRCYVCVAVWPRRLRAAMTGPRFLIISSPTPYAHHSTLSAQARR